MASFKDFLAKKQASSAPKSAGESAPPVPAAKEARGLHLSGNFSKPAMPEVPDEQTLLRQIGILPPGVARKLGETVPDVPFVFPSKNDSHERRLLKAALLAEETKLGVWINPESTDADAWIAVQVQDDPNLLLLHRLPLLNRKSELSAPF